MTTQEISLPRYEVIVGNVGSVISTDDYREAYEVFGEYCSQSESDYGRAGREDVYLLDQGEPIHELQNQYDL